MLKCDDPALKITSDKIELIIKTGKLPSSSGMSISSLSVDGESIESIEIFGEKVGDGSCEISIEPLFFKSSKVDFLLISRTEGELKLEIPDMGICYFGGTVIWNSFNIGDSVGRHKLCVSIDDRVHMEIEFDVFFKRIQYREDYRLIRKNISSETDVASKFPELDSFLEETLNLPPEKTDRLFANWSFIRLCAILGKYCRYIGLCKNKANIDTPEDEVQGSDSDEGRKSGIFGMEFAAPERSGKLILKFDGEYAELTHLCGGEIRKYLFYPGYVAPEDSDIDILHRKKNELMLSSDEANAVYLFAGTAKSDASQRDENLDASKRTGVCLIPVMPGEESEVEDYLSEYVIRSIDSSAFANKNVLVGSIGSAEQLEMNLKDNFYYVPEKYLPEDLSFVKYVALYESGKYSDSGIRYFAEVESYDKKKRSEIAVPMRHNNDNELYWVFRLKDWRRLINTIDVDGEYVDRPKFTSLFMLFNGKKAYELFSVNNADEYRLLQELRRSVGGRAPFMVGENIISVKGGEIVISRENMKKPAVFKINDFSRSPKVVFNNIKNLIFNCK